MFIGLKHKLIYNIGYFLAFVKDIPRLIKFKYYEIKCGGANNIPKEISQKHLEDVVNQIYNSADYQFTIALGMLHDHFSVPMEKSSTFTMIQGYYHGNLKRKEDYEDIAEIMHSSNPRRALFNYMKEKKDITDHKINFYFPEGEKRDKLEKWLNMDANLLSK